ncbi:hypothetical protein KEM48_002530 [Puccinia striiformis f. sp. tritici PST-130]|nr:hypothetical protein KEM48_002530 [Puccinia striiformis f. sp. tritici PST-130]
MSNTPSSSKSPVRGSSQSSLNNHATDSTLSEPSSSTLSQETLTQSQSTFSRNLERNSNVKVISNQAKL